MSSSYSTYPSRQDLLPVDAATVIETIHGLQVDLSILAAWLARRHAGTESDGVCDAMAEWRKGQTK